MIKIKMSWPAVILYAVGAAVLTTVFLVVPAFKGTSFERMGVHLEAWIFFAVIIMANCEKPLESALKTFVFFLISQPLINLFQVPFSPLGWVIFVYYRYWFIWTLLTLPMAYIGWYIKKKNWLSLLILSPAFAFLGYTFYVCASECIRNFPHLIIAALFCALQIALYIKAFLPKTKQKLAGVIIPAVVVILFALFIPQVDLTVVEPLPGEPSFSEDAVVSVEDAKIAEAQLKSAKEGVICVHAHKYGTTTFTIKDGGREFSYSVEIYDDNGYEQAGITFLGQNEALQ